MKTQRLILAAALATSNAFAGDTVIEDYCHQTAVDRQSFYQLWRGISELTLKPRSEASEWQEYLAGWYRNGPHPEDHGRKIEYGMLAAAQTSAKRAYDTVYKKCMVDQALHK